MGLRDDLESIRRPKKVKDTGPPEGYDYQLIDNPYPEGTVLYLEGMPFIIVGFMYSPTTTRTQVLLESVTHEEAANLG